MARKTTSNTRSTVILFKYTSHASLIQSDGHPEVQYRASRDNSMATTRQIQARNTRNALRKRDAGYEYTLDHENDHNLHPAMYATSVLPTISESARNTQYRLG